MISLGCGAAQVGEGHSPMLVDPHGGYARKALEKQTINLSVIQTKAILIKDVTAAGETIAKNLENMVQKGTRLVVSLISQILCSFMNFH